MHDAIIKFSGAYGFLSNFYVGRQVYSPFDGHWYATVEHAYQAAKTEDDEERVEIASAATPGEAKKLGRKVALREDWDAIKVGLMLELIRQKFRDVELAASLRRTGDALLVEGNYWHDNFWGRCYCRTCPGFGANTLGRLLMMVREELEADNG